MGCTIKTSFCLRVTLSMRSPVAMSNGCAPVLASYSAITSFTSSMLAVAGSYSRSVVSPRDENVRILAFLVGLLLPFILSALGKQAAGLCPCRLYCTVSESCQYSFPVTNLRAPLEVKFTPRAESGVVRQVHVRAAKKRRSRMRLGSLYSLHITHTSSFLSILCNL